MGPNFANTNLDTPSLPGSIPSLIEDSGRVIIDVGGDDAGATALGVYSSTLAKADPDVLYVINRYRSMTTHPEEAEEILGEIERASRLKATGIVNNSHLKHKTGGSTILESIGFADEVSKLTGLPIKFTAVPRNINLLNKIPNIYPIDVCVRAPWE